MGTVGHPHDDATATRRRFLTSAASGLGSMALGSLLAGEGVLPATGDVVTDGGVTGGGASPERATRKPHFEPTARRAIFIYLAGGISQIELLDPKPRLTELTGKPLPQSFAGNEKRLSFLKLDSARLMGSRFGFRRYGECGMELSELLPSIGSRADDIAVIRSMHTDEFDHGPAEMFFSTGDEQPGRPSAGAWIVYGLGTETRDLPAYVVLMTGRAPVARSINWGSGFLPASNGGVLFRSRGEPLLNLANPPGVLDVAQRRQLDAVRALDRRRLERVGDRAIAERVEAYELAFRMQAAAPELVDLAGEPPETLEAYGVGRDDEEEHGFATNCLLARRLVERGVRFVSIFQRRWDHHSGLEEKIQKNCRVIDQPIGALLGDLKERGLLDSTLVVCGTEFGRTPVTQNSEPGRDAGRDHHRFAYSVWLAGGGVRGGQAIGKTDELGWHAVEDRVHVHDFHATLLHLFGLDHLKLTYRFKGLDFRLTDQGGRVVSRVLG